MDWISKKSDSEIKRLIYHKSLQQCGNCEFWMKSLSCPKEENARGYNHGPSMNHIACRKFKLSTSSKNIIADYELELFCRNI